MTGLSWPQSPYSVLVAAASDSADVVEAGARRAGASVVGLDLSGIGDRQALVERLGHVFMFPVAASGLDAAVDWISDLEWFGSTGGYLVRVEGLDGLPESVIEDFSSILPAIIDRWRSQAKPFVVILVGASHASVAVSALTGANRELRAHGQLPWAQPGTGPVPVVDCRADREV